MEPPPQFVSENAAPRHRSSSRPDLDDTTAQQGQYADVQGQMAQMIFNAGSQQVKQVFSSYGRLDYLRPYFDVEPKTVRNRLLQSLMPRKPALMNPPTDYYGPLMLVFTLVALLLFTMKFGNYQVQDGTLIGTALLTCFTYWITTTIVIGTLCYVFLCDITFASIGSVVGYGLFAHCIVIGITALWHPQHDGYFSLEFLIMLAIFGGLSSGIIFAAKAKHRQHKLVLIAAITMLHCCFLLYLHFGFETMVEEIDAELDTMLGHEPLQQQMKPAVESIASTR